MARTITVKGIGSASVKPDQIEIHLSLSAKDKQYDKAMELASEQISRLYRAVEKAGLEKDNLKTTHFDVTTDYDRVRDKYGNYHEVFNGYECSHDLKLTFDFNTTTLSNALNAITNSRINPKIKIKFTIKNPSAVSELILQDATENARRKAEILCRASGVSLGKLLLIDYNWGEVTFVSPTRYDYDDCMIAAPAGHFSGVEIEPENIKASDTATFVWEIE